ncbi:MAG: hypothetical protein ABI169_18800, partial [Chitinophagaceae bacterium]
MRECKPNWRKSGYTITLLLAIVLFPVFSTFAQTGSNANSVTVLFLEDPAPTELQPILQLKLTGQTFNEACAYYELLQKAKDTATILDANLLKVVSRKSHSAQQKCDALT